MTNARSKSIRIAGALVGLVASAGRGAPSMPPMIMTVPGGSELHAALTSGMSIERYLADLVQPLRSAESGAAELTKADVMIERRSEVASRRASALSEVMHYDLDGDGVVTRDEVLQANRRSPRPSSLVEALFDRYDADGDGRITIPEIYAVQADGDQGYRAGRLEALLRLDPNGDGRLTIAELTTIGRAVFAQVDTDGDGTISPAEYQASEPLRRRWMENDRREEADRVGPRCFLPPVPAGAQVVALGTYSGSAVSPVSVGGNDVATDFTAVHVEEGSTPLYIVLASYESMVWKFDGAIGRVAQVVATSFVKKGGTPAVGTAGVKADRVSFIRGDCLSYFHDAKSAEADRAHGVLHRSLGREPDAIVATYSARSVSLPSGTIEPADGRAPAPVPAGFDPTSWPDAVRFWPAGIGAVDAGKVVSKLPVVVYDILPSQMGMSQLIGRGDMVRDPAGGFRITRPIAHFPARMTGAHAEILTVDKGVPLPSGDPGHSCVRMADGSASPTGPTCRQK